MTPIGLFVLAFVLLVSALVLTINDQKGKRYSLFFSVLLVFFYAILMLIRDVASGSDFSNYTEMYNKLDSFAKVWSAYHRNYTFSFLQYLGRTTGLTSEQFHTIFSLGTALLVYRAFYLFFDDKRQALVTFSLFLLSSTFIFMYANILRQGLALSLTMLAVAYYWKQKRFKFFVFSVLAIFAHFSAAIFLVAALLGKWLPLSKKLARFYLVVLPLLPVVGYLALKVTGLTALSQDLERYSEHGYNSSIFYVKLVISYLFLLSLFVFSSKCNRNCQTDLNFPIRERHTYIYSVYGYLIAASFIFLTIPIISSRLHYFSNALMPMLAVTFLFSSFKLKFELKVAIVFLFAISVGLVSYFYPSSASQLGVYG